MERNRPNEAEVRELTLGQVIHILRRKIWWILVWGVVAAVLAGIITKCFVTPTYTSYTTMYVYTTQEPDSVGSISSSDLLAAESLANTYREILQSNTVFSAVCDHLNARQTIITLTCEDLEEQVKVSTIPDTQLLKIEVTTIHPKLSRLVADGFAEVGPREIVRITRVGGVEILDYPQLPTQADGPDLVKNVALALAAGWMAAAIFFLAGGLCDPTKDVGIQARKPAGKTR